VCTSAIAERTMLDILDLESNLSEWGALAVKPPKKGKLPLFEFQLRERP